MPFADWYVTPRRLVGGSALWSGGYVWCCVSLGSALKRLLEAVWMRTLGCGCSQGCGGKLWSQADYCKQKIWSWWGCNTIPGQHTRWSLYFVLFTVAEALYPVQTDSPTDCIFILIPLPEHLGQVIRSYLFGLAVLATWQGQKCGLSGRSWKLLCKNMAKKTHITCSFFPPSKLIKNLTLKLPLKFSIWNQSNKTFCFFNLALNI